MLEAKQYVDNAYVTLTYSSDHYPADGSLNPREAQLWLKRFRKAFGRPVRYFLVGEYGEENHGPHYHAILFGVPSCHYGNSRYSKIKRSCCPSCDLVRDTWGKGHVFVGTVEAESAAYVCGYVVKKFNRSEPALGDRYPEFARMSLKPGIGASAVSEIASLHLTYNIVETHGDVNSQLRHGPRVMALGRYLTRRLRREVGLSPDAQPATIQKQQEKLLPLQLSAIEATQGSGMAKHRRWLLKNLILEKYEGQSNALLSRAKIKRKRGTL